MNLETIDEFLYLKSILAIDNYFSYLQKGFDLIDAKSNDIPQSMMNIVSELYSCNNVHYQVVSTTFVNEIFHVVEIYLKSNLLRVGDYLIYPSIDKYPENREKLERFNLGQSAEVKNLLVQMAKAVNEGKDNRLEQLSKKIGHQLYSEPKELLVNSVSCSEALDRLEKYLRWTITEEAKERFKLFIENRNDIVHFNKLTNLTFACSHSLFVLVNLCQSKADLYPKFSSIPGYIEGRLPKFNILIQEILLNLEIDKVMNKIRENASFMNQVFKQST